MSLLPLIIIALLQGVTEFLPVSSSGHIVLAENIFHNGENSNLWDTHMTLNVAVHLGTLLSVLIYFHKDIKAMLFGLKDLARKDISAPGAKLNLNIMIGSVPVIIAGFALHILEPSWLLSMHIVAWTTLLYGILLWGIDYLKPADKTINAMPISHAALIGLAQSLALIPGTSRSGITMTAARALGYSRTDSAHFSLLLAIIAIAGAGTISVLSLLKDGSLALGLDMLIAAFIAFLAGWLSIALMMKWLEKCSFAVFGIYRILLGGALLALLYWPA